MINKKLHWSILIFFCLVLGALHLNSTIWFRVRLADYYMRTQNYDKAIFSYKKILRKESLSQSLTPHLKATISSQLTTAYIKTAKLHFYGAQDFLSTNDLEKSLQRYQKIIKLSNDYSKTFNRYLLLKSDNEIWKKIRADAHFNFGKYLFIYSRLNESIEQFKQIAEFYPTYEDISLFHISTSNDYKRFGLLLSGIGLERSAIKQFQKFVELEPNDLLGHYRLALIYQRQGMRTDAIGEFKKIADLYFGKSNYITNTPPSFLGNIYYYLALDLEEKGNWDEAIKDYEKALEFNNNGIIDAYYRLRSLYEKQSKKEGVDRINFKLMNLKPRYEINHKFNNNIILLGYSLNEIEFEMSSQFNITLYWKVTGSLISEARNSIVSLVHESSGRRLYRAGDRWYEVKTVTNLAPNPGFEIDAIGVGFPTGWTGEMYAAPAESYEIAVESVFDFSNNQFFLLNNTKAKRTGRMAGPIPISSQHYYLEAGRLKGYRSNACLGREWRNSLTGKEASYNYVITAVASPDWQTYSQVVKPPPGADFCYLWVLNFETEGKAYFDNILFVEISLPDELLSQLR